MATNVEVGQEWLITAQESTRDAEWLEKARKHNEKVASIDGMLKTMSDYDLDFIVSCTDGPISSVSALAGEPNNHTPSITWLTL